MTEITNFGAAKNLTGREPSGPSYDPIAALNKAIELSSNSLKAQRNNLHTSEETLAKTSPWDSKNGNKLIFEADYQQDQARYTKFAFAHKQLIKTQATVEKLLAEGKTTEAAELTQKILNKQKELLKSETSSSKELQELYDQQIQELERSEKHAKIVAHTAVAAAATVATVGTGGVVGVVVGVTAGATVGAAKNIAGAVLDTFAYGKDGLDASIQVFENTESDTYIAAKASTAAYAGTRAASALVTPTTLLAKTGTAAVAGTAATATSLTISTAERVHLAEEALSNHLGSWADSVSPEEEQRLRKDFYAKQGLDLETLVKEGAIDLAVGLVSGAQGGVATAAREATRNGIKQALVTGAEVAGTAVIGTSASVAKHGNTSSAFEETAGATLATLTGGAVTSKSSKLKQASAIEEVAPTTTPASALHEPAPTQTKSIELKPTQAEAEPVIAKPSQEIKKAHTDETTTISKASAHATVVATIPSAVKHHSLNLEKMGTPLPVVKGAQMKQHSGVELKFENSEMPLALPPKLKYSETPGELKITQQEITDFYNANWKPMFNNGVKVTSGVALNRHTGSGLIHIREDHFQAQKVERLIKPIIDDKGATVGYEQQTANIFPYKLSDQQIITIIHEGMHNPVQPVVSDRDPRCLNIFGKINNPKLAPGVTEVRITVDNETGVLTMVPNKGDFIVARLVAQDKQFNVGDKTAAFTSNPVIVDQNGTGLKVVYTKVSKGKEFINETGPEELPTGNN